MAVDHMGECQEAKRELWALPLSCYTPSQGINVDTSKIPLAWIASMCLLMDMKNLLNFSLPPASKLKAGSPSTSEVKSEHVYWESSRQSSMIWLQVVSVSFITQVTLSKPRSPSELSWVSSSKKMSCQPQTICVRIKWKNVIWKCFANFNMLQKFREFSTWSLRRLGASLAGKVFWWQPSP